MLYIMDQKIKLLLFLIFAKTTFFTIIRVRYTSSSANDTSSLCKKKGQIKKNNNNKKKKKYKINSCKKKK
ncbi:hypothetical protein PMLGA01_060005000 [Plasmodium malariae]|uniref:Uncharacterized protein n=1 Tax=Plasmodium malariae TaxID=5858 RepID=A0A1C3KAV6_PLAMA|nr:hypothetical protein PMLGA01_060005000 [Plasmodium malariae]